MFLVKELQKKKKAQLQALGRSGEKSLVLTRQRIGSAMQKNSTSFEVEFFKT
jgi:hypothetical protein